jgi:hypothetical protein
VGSVVTHPVHHRVSNEMRPPALRSQPPEEDVAEYAAALTSGIITSGSSYPSFLGPAHHDDPTMENGFSSYHSQAILPHAQTEHASRSHHNNTLYGEDAATPPGSPPRPQTSVTVPSSDYPPPPPQQRSAAPIIPNGAPRGQFDMLPPPISTHPSWQALHDYAQSHASAHGYALSINTTAKNRSRIKLACVCYGAPKNTHKLTPETRVRKNRVSYKTGCRMWVEGKKQEDGVWALRVGEPHHNHPGRPVEGWAVQRKRTWGVQGGRIGVGGVTAKEEQEKSNGAERSGANVEDGDETLLGSKSPTATRKASHSLEMGGLVWRIVEQEMLRKGGSGQSRDRGVGRTVKALEERLPGIHIYKRDVYNIRAQIKRARKAAGQEIGEGLNDSEHEGAMGVVGFDQSSLQQDLAEAPHMPSSRSEQDRNGRGFSEIDPMLVAQCNDALRTVTQQEESELERLRRQNEELRQALHQRTKELEEKTRENESLRVQFEMAHMAIYNGRGHEQ